MTPILLTTLLQAMIGDPNQFNNYLVLGYAAMWIIGLVYVISLSVRQRNLTQDVRLLKRLLQEDEDSADS